MCAAHFLLRLPRVVAAYGRPPVRLNEALYLIGLMLGGQAGAKLALRLGMSVSPDTLVRRIQHASVTCEGDTPCPWG